MINYSSVLANPIAAKLASIRGARMVTFTTVTEPKMRKTGNPYAEHVVKYSRVNACINFDYSVAATKAAESQGETYVPGRSAYVHIPGPNGERTPFLTDAKTGTKIYVQLKPLNTKSFFAMKDGTEIDKEKLSPFFPPYQEQLTPVRSYFVDSLLELTVDSQVFTVSNELEIDQRLVAALDEGIAAIKARILNHAK